MGLLTLRECPEAYHELLGVSFSPLIFPSLLFQYLGEFGFSHHYIGTCFFRKRPRTDAIRRLPPAIRTSFSFVNQPSHAYVSLALSFPMRTTSNFFIAITRHLGVAVAASQHCHRNNWMIIFAFRYLALNVHPSSSNLSWVVLFFYI